MPVPKPHSGETEKDFVSRCMGDSAMVAEYESDQRAAICYRTFRDRNKKSAAFSGLTAMRLYGSIEKVEPLSDGTVRVHGIASSESVDDQGEIVSASAMRAALPDYMRFPALREMHQLSAAGTTLEAEVGEDGITRIVGHVVDPIAVAKVKNQVYRGFSIGGRVTQREPGNTKTITGLALTEISLVDRPANPSAIFDMWKSSMPDELAQATAAPFNPPIQVWHCGVEGHQHIAKAEAIKCQEKRAAGSTEPTEDVLAKGEDDQHPAEEMDEAEIEKRATEGAAAAQALIDAALKAVESGEIALAKAEPEADEPAVEPDEQVTKDDDEVVVDKAEDSSKPYGNVNYADPGYQSDKKKRYPLDSEGHVRAAWSYINMPKNAGKYSAQQVSSIKSKIRSAGKKYDINFSEKSSQDAFAKSLWDIGEAAMLIASLDAMCDRLELERAMEGDDSTAPDSCEAACAAACALLRILVSEATQEILNDTEIDEPVGSGMAPMMMSAIAQSLSKAIPDPEKVEQLMETIGKIGARHRAEVQAQLDLAAHAIDRAMDVGNLKRAEMVNAGEWHKAVLEAGATAWGAPIEGREMLTDGNPSGDPGQTQHATVDTGSNGQISVPNATGAVPASPWPKVAKAVDPVMLERFESALKANAAGKALLSVAHDLLCSVSGGATCKEGAAKPGHLSRDDMVSLHKAHGHAMAIDGVKCEANAPPGGAPDAEGEAVEQGTVNTAKVVEVVPASPPELPGEDLAKALAAERATTAALVKTMGAMVPMVERMAARVEQIAEADKPARAVARAGVIGINKTQDGMPLGGSPPQNLNDQEANFATWLDQNPMLKAEFIRRDNNGQAFMKTQYILATGGKPYDPAYPIG